MTSTLNRRQFVGRTAAAAGLAAAGPLGPAFAASDRMNILCWEGYNSDEVLGPFREANPSATVRAESSDTIVLYLSTDELSAHASASSSATTHKEYITLFLGNLILKLNKSSSNHAVWEINGQEFGSLVVEQVMFDKCIRQYPDAIVWFSLWGKTAQRTASDSGGGARAFSAFYRKYETTLDAAVDATLICETN